MSRNHIHRWDLLPLNRRHLLRGSATVAGLSLAGLGGCAPASLLQEQDLASVRASPDRLANITVCLRPLRAIGPRLDTEQVGDTFVVHNYGHGGSGWSLSWGSSTVAVQKALAASPRAVAVIGCGVIGLTSAILAQSAGTQVTIYARELLPATRSWHATGSWSPDSRVALASAAPMGFAADWEQMARVSFKMHRHYMDLPGNLVMSRHHFNLSDLSPSDTALPRIGYTPQFAEYHERIRDLVPADEAMAPGGTPFPMAYVRRSTSMVFNIADYGHALMKRFLAAGGKIQMMEFHAPSDLALLNEKVVINCPGYGGRALWKDQSIVPVRGQIAWLTPQPEVDYGLTYKNLYMVSRQDGIVLQIFQQGEMTGYGDSNENLDRTEANNALASVAALYSRFRRPSGA
jgi:D-amino-acid oxidase